MAKNQNEQGNAGNPPSTGASIGNDQKTQEERVQAAKDGINKMLDDNKIELSPESKEKINNIIEARIVQNDLLSNRREQRNALGFNAVDERDLMPVMMRHYKDLLNLFTEVESKGEGRNSSDPYKLFKETAEILIKDQVNENVRTENTGLAEFVINNEKNKARREQAKNQQNQQQKEVTTKREANSGNDQKTLDERIKAAKDGINKILTDYRIETPPHLIKEMDNIIKARIQYNIDTSNSVVQQENHHERYKDMGVMLRHTEPMVNIFTNIATRSGRINIRDTNRFVRKLAEILINDQDNKEVRKNNIESLDPIMSFMVQKETQTIVPANQQQQQAPNKQAVKAEKDQKKPEERGEAAVTGINKILAGFNIKFPPQVEKMMEDVIGEAIKQNKRTNAFDFSKKSPVREKRLELINRHNKELVSGLEWVVKRKEAQSLGAEEKKKLVNQLANVINDAHDNEVLKKINTHNFKLLTDGKEYSDKDLIAKMNDALKPYEQSIEAAKQQNGSNLSPATSAKNNEESAAERRNKERIDKKLKANELFKESIDNIKGEFSAFKKQGNVNISRKLPPTPKAGNKGHGI